MSDETTDVLEQQAVQRAGAKRATFDLLRSKRPREREFSVKLSGMDEPVSFLFRAIGAIEYDKLLSKCPPTLEQKAENATYDPDRFAPLLLSRVSLEPALSSDEWAQIWKSGEWSRGETSDLFYAAVNLCGQGLEVDPTGAG